MILVKLGGSVITDKTRLRSFRKEAVERLVTEMREVDEPIIIVHGAGSFGHVLASRYALHLGKRGGEQLQGLSQVMADVRDLNLRVMRIVNREGRACASLPPSTIARLDGGKLIALDHGAFESYLDLGVTPLTFGDVCLDLERGFGICSGDQLMESLASHFLPRSIIFCTDVDGIFNRDPHLDPKAKLLERVTGETLDSLPRTERCDDVTGSIYGKIECMLRMSSFTRECLVINGNVEGRLRSALSGEEVIGSKVVGDG